MLAATHRTATAPPTIPRLLDDLIRFTLCLLQSTDFVHCLSVHTSASTACVVHAMMASELTSPPCDIESSSSLDRLGAPQAPDLLEPFVFSVAMRCLVLFVAVGLVATAAATGGAPEQVHLSLTRNVSQVVVTFATMNAGGDVVAASDASGYVQYGRASGQYTGKVCVCVCVCVCRVSTCVDTSFLEP